MRILVLGAGGTGGYFGGRLAEAGVDVTFLVRERRRAQLERDGLRIASPLGGVQMPVKTVLSEGLRPDYDIVLLTCKAYDLDSAMDAIAPAMAGDCAVVPILNGMSHLERLDRRFGRDAVMGGTCVINAELRGDGTVVQSTKLQRIVFGERHGGRTPRAEALAEAFKLTSLDWELSDDIVQNLWEKIVTLSALAALTCLFRASIGEIMAAPGGHDAAVRTLDANIATATREGHPPRDAAVAFARNALTDSNSATTASMLRDLESGGRIESDHIVGWMLDRARQHGVDDTMLSIAYTHLKAYEARRANGRLPAAPGGAAW